MAEFLSGALPFVYRISAMHTGDFLHVNQVFSSFLIAIFLPVLICRTIYGSFCIWFVCKSLAMSRNIVTRSDVQTFETRAAQSGDAVPQEDKYTDKLIKLIPAEIVSVYLAVYALIKSSAYAQSDKQFLQWCVFLVVLALTPVYLYRLAGVTKWTQILFNTLAFVIWVFSFGGPAEGLYVHNFPLPFLVAVFLPVYTLFIPLFYRPATGGAT